jgi:hypothetical protein
MRNKTMAEWILLLATCFFQLVEWLLCLAIVVFTVVAIVRGISVEVRFGPRPDWWPSWLF